MKIDDIDQAIKRSDLVTWAGQNTDATVTLTAMDMAYIGAILALFQANAWLSNEPDECLTVSEIDHAMWSLCNPGETMKFAIVRDVKNAGSNGGTFTAGAWQQRTLNELLDPTGLVSLLSNNITIVTGGNYFIRATCPATGVLYHQARLTKNGVQIAVGDGGLIGAVAANTVSTVLWVGTLMTGDVIKVEHRCQQTYNTYGMGGGEGVTWGNVVFSVVEIVQF